MIDSEDPALDLAYTVGVYYYPWYAGDFHGAGLKWIAMNRVIMRQTHRGDNEPSMARRLPWNGAR